MALVRFRRKRVYVVMLIACLFWLMYLFFFLPSKGGMMSFPGNPVPDAEEKERHFNSASRIYFTAAFIPPSQVEPNKNVIEPPNLPEVKKDREVKKTASPGANSEVLGKPDSKISNADSSRTLPGVKLKVEPTNKEETGLMAMGKGILDKGYELGVKLANKSVDVGEKVKNKTLEQLAMIGGSSSKNLPQLVFVPMKWNLNVSFDDIGDLMKETEFLNKVNPLNLNGPILVSSRNRTANFTYNMPLKFGYCDCFERYCFCCSQITNKKLHLNYTVCSNFTFVSKTHELDLQLSLDKQLVHRSLISANKSPLLCIGSNPKVVDICVHFFNMTFKVNEHNAHQTQLLGCTDFSLNFYNRTIGAFPVDCFQIPGDPNQVHKERKFNMMFNWVP